MECAREPRREAQRERAAALCLHLYEVEGIGVEELARRLGRQPSTIRGYLNDPDGEKARRRKERYRGHCEICGSETSGGDGPGRALPVCRRCRAAAGRRWDRERVLAAMARWERRYGRPPTSYDWNATTARRRGQGAARRWREGHWPAASTVSEVFGGWRTARLAYQARAGARIGLDAPPWQTPEPHADPVSPEPWGGADTLPR
jgi:hypothetical protein